MVILRLGGHGDGSSNGVGVGGHFDGLVGTTDRDCMIWEKAVRGKIEFDI